MIPTTLSRTAVRLTARDPDMLPYLEELLWTLDTVESVTMLTKPDFYGMEAIGLGETFAEAVETLLQDHEIEEDILVESVRSIQEEDWAESWKQYWKVTRLLPDLIIQPSWEPYDPQPDEVVLKLDPGQAFGTGTHETTQLMLMLVRDTLQQKRDLDSMLDVGCGSGILAIYGAKLGLPRVLAEDIDPIAVEVTRQNAINNDVRIDTTKVPLAECPGMPFGLITANILTKVLVEMMPQLKAALHPNGNLLLSGIAKTQAQDILNSLKANQMEVQRLVQKKDWLALVCCHRG